jgi:hypothetical protein
MAAANHLKPLPIQGNPRIHEDRPAAALFEPLDAVIRADPQRASQNVRPKGVVVDAKDELAELDHGLKVKKNAKKHGVLSFYDYNVVPSWHG